jgi:hypothetical protein
MTSKTTKQKNDKQASQRNASTTDKQANKTQDGKQAKITMTSQNIRHGEQTHSCQANPANKARRANTTCHTNKHAKRKTASHHMHPKPTQT